MDRAYDLAVERLAVAEVVGQAWGTHNNAMKLTKGGWWGSAGWWSAVVPFCHHRGRPRKGAPFAAYRRVRQTAANPLEAVTDRVGVFGG